MVRSRQMCEQPPLLSRHSFISKTNGGWLRYKLGISMWKIHRRCMGVTCSDLQRSIIYRGFIWRMHMNPQVDVLSPWTRFKNMECATLLTPCWTTLIGFYGLSDSFFFSLWKMSCPLSTNGVFLCNCFTVSHNGQMWKKGIVFQSQRLTETKAL